MFNNFHTRNPPLLLSKLITLNAKRLYNLPNWYSYLTTSGNTVMIGIINPDEGLPLKYDVHLTWHLYHFILDANYVGRSFEQQQRCGSKILPCKSLTATAVCYLPIWCEYCSVFGSNFD